MSQKSRRRRAAVWHEHRAQAVHDILNDGVHRTLAHADLGAVVWAVKRGRLHAFIACYALEQRAGNGWKYTEQRESAHPNHYGCPLQFFAMAPAACEPWRREARARQASSAHRFELRSPPCLMNEGSRQ